MSSSVESECVDNVVVCVYALLWLSGVDVILPLPQTEIFLQGVVLYIELPTVC